LSGKETFRSGGVHETSTAPNAGASVTARADHPGTPGGESRA